MQLQILDHLSDPGSAGKRNEDNLHLGEDLLAVFDGATGIGDWPVFPEQESDAAWLSEFAAQRLAGFDPGLPASRMVREIASAARQAVAERTDIDALPRYAWPTCGFEMARVRQGRLELSGLGDCCAYLLAPSGELTIHCPIPSAREVEMAAARSLLDRTGGFGPQGGIVREGETLEVLRRGRSRHNTPGGTVWTLGLVPQAGDHVSTLTVNAPEGALLLLMSDGFAALAEMYLHHSPAELVSAAADSGLAPLLRNLRRIEQVEDPHAERFARFKRSDDATAILAVTA